MRWLVDPPGPDLHINKNHFLSGLASLRELIDARTETTFYRTANYNACRNQLNRDIYETVCAFFREIDRADELGSGMRNLMKYGRKYGGADPKLIEGDVFRMIISVPEFDATGKQTQQVKRLLSKTKDAKSRAKLMASLSLKDRVNFTRNYLEPALALELIEMTQPDSPKSPTQKYRLTEKRLRLAPGV
jgi:predicted HTH transcriptional regulator